MTKLSNVVSIARQIMKDVDSKPPVSYDDIFKGYKEALASNAISDKQKKLKKQNKKSAKKINKLLKKAAETEVRIERAAAKAQAKEVGPKATQLKADLEVTGAIQSPAEVRLSELSPEKRAQAIAAINDSIGTRPSEKTADGKSFEMSVTEGPDGVLSIDAAIGRLDPATSPATENAMAHAMRNASKGNANKGNANRGNAGRGQHHVARNTYV